MQIAHHPTQQLVMMPETELQGLFNYLRGKIFAFDALYGQLMIQAIGLIVTEDSQIKMTLNLKNIFRSQFHLIDLIAGNQKLSVFQNNDEKITFSDRSRKWYDLFETLYSDNLRTIPKMNLSTQSTSIAAPNQTF